MEPDPRWADRFEAERGPLERLLGPWLDGGLHHVGSTAVPGLPARPIVDILAGVSSPEAARQAADALELAGWRAVPDSADGGLRLCKPSPEHPECELELLPAGSPRFTERLELREALREDPLLAQAFGVLKRELAARAPRDGRGFAEAKSGFIAGVLRGRSEGRDPAAGAPPPEPRQGG